MLEKLAGPLPEEGMDATAMLDGLGGICGTRADADG